MDTEKGIITMMMVVVMAGVMLAILPPPAEPPPPTGFGCPYCISFFDTMSELIAHIGEVHPEMPPFVEVDIGWG